MSDIFRVLVGVPSGSEWNAQFGVSLVNLVGGFTRKPISGYRASELRVANVRSSVLSRNRMDLVSTAQAFRASHLLFLDTDHTFPVDLIHGLAGHHKLIVAANCVTKSIPAQPTARAKAEKPEGVPVYSDPDKHGLEQVWRVGTGVMLVNMQVFERIGQGVWDMKYLADRGAYQGEDWTFCEHCEAEGIPIYVDHDISRKVGHVGQMTFTHDLVGELSGV